MKLELLKSANKSYIFYTDDTHEKLTADKVPEIIAFAAREIAFYGRLYDELGKQYNEANDALKRMKCPSDDDIKNADLLTEIHMEQQREKFKEQCVRLDQISEMLKGANRKYSQYRRIMEVLTK